MRSPSAREIMERGLRHGTEVVTGSTRSVLGMSGSRTANSTIASMGMLPCDITPTALQTSTGAFIFLIGYSNIDGNDLIG